MTDPVTPTEQPDETTPAPEEDSEVELGAWVDARKPEPADTPRPPEVDA